MSGNTLPTQFPVLALPTAIDYTSKDYAALRQSMLDFAAQAWPQWNTASEGDFGVIMLELFAYAGDIMGYYNDRISQEAYLPTATQRNSLLNIAATLGYVPSNGTPSSGTVTFQTTNPGPPVTVPAGTQVASSFSVASTGEPAIFETQTDTLVTGDGGTAQALVIQGQSRSGIAIGVSDGTPGMTFALPELGVQDKTTQVFVQTTEGSEEWFQIEFLVDAGPEDKVFAVTVDQTGATNVVFGDNVNGLIPGLGFAISADYRVIIGASGNLPAGAVSSIVQSIPGVLIPFLADNITPNSSAMAGGSDAETNDQIRKNAPAAFRTQFRAVSPQDYADLALNVPGVLMATAVGNHSTSVSLYVLGPNYGPPGDELVDNILTYFEDKTLAGVSISVVDPAIIPVDVGSVSSPVQLDVQTKFSRGVVTANVTAALQALLSPPNVSFGQLLTVSDIYAAIRSVAGVNFAIIPVFTREDDVQTNTNSIQFRPTEIPSAGQINITATGGL